MALADLILHDEEYQKIRALLERLRKDANARIVFLLDRNGQPIAFTGEMAETDPTSLASLAAGNVAATEGLAKLVGEQEFANLYHEGERDNLHINLVGKRMILVVVFDEHSSLGLVRLRVKKATVELTPLLDDVERRSEETAKSGAPEAIAFADITDADLDALFND
jgi:predicted regulator of Ras-like GTPase activity (Roadblock/LC7/MglB family)